MSHPLSQLKRVLIMAGGTGGHVFPGLALAASLRARGVEVHWLGTEKGLESRLVPAKGLPLHVVSIGGLRGKGIQTLLAAPFRLLKALYQSRQIIRRIQPDVIVGMGGFVSGPGGMAGWMSRYPLVIHEQNAKAGLTNQLLSRVAKRVLAGFPGAFKANGKVIVMGNPVRVDIESLPLPETRFAEAGGRRLRLLVLGGSLGAKALNEMVPKALALLSDEERPDVLHQCGDKHADETRNLYKSMHLDVKVQPFIEDMASAYSWADVVLCRAGALTVAELCAAGIGALLVPYPFAVDDHQTANADFMVKQHAAVCIQQADLNETCLVEWIRELNDAPDKRLAMANAARKLRYSHVAEKMADVLNDVVMRGSK